MTERIMKTSLLVFVAGALLVGCNTNPLKAPAAVTGQSKADPLYVPEAQAGVTLTNPTEGQDPIWTVAENRYWPSRNDPFALLGEEREFEQNQLMEYVLDNSGGFGVFFEEPEEVEDTGPRRVPPPAWRLAGVVVSEGAVLALLDKTPGVEVIRPGAIVEGTNWQCVTISQDFATFRYIGQENIVPNQITVPLGAPLIPGGGSGGAGTGGGGGLSAPGRSGGGGGLSAPGRSGGDQGGRDADR